MRRLGLFLVLFLSVAGIAISSDVEKSDQNCTISVMWRAADPWHYAVDPKDPKSSECKGLIIYKLEVIYDQEINCVHFYNARYTLLNPSRSYKEGYVLFAFLNKEGKEIMSNRDAFDITVAEKGKSNGTSSMFQISLRPEDLNMVNTLKVTVHTK